jgi:2-hydroxychromene-2-carboxylate isomerase
MSDACRINRRIRNMSTSPPAHWYFDFISPFSYLQLARVQAWRSRIDIVPVPIVFGAVLKHHGQLGPAEIPSKREFTYRFVQWQARHAGQSLLFPPAHPFNPLAALRLCIAAGGDWDAVAAIFEHIWRDGRSAADADDLIDVGHTLGIAAVATAIDAPEVKTRLRANTDAAIAASVFGVPTLRIGDELWWGNDASDMIEERMAAGPAAVDAEAARVAALPYGVERRR